MKKNRRWQNDRDNNGSRNRRIQKSEKELPLHRGKYRGTSKNYGFVELEDKTSESDADIFIPNENNKAGAIPNDDVLIKIVPSHDFRTKTGFEGIIVEVLKRNTEWCTGVLKVKNGEYFVISDKKSGGIEIFVNRKHLNGAEADDLVKVNLSGLPHRKSQKKNRIKDKNAKIRLYGEIDRVLGTKDSALANYENILLSHGIKTQFDDELIEYSQSISTNISDTAYEGREDLRKKIIFTIDSNSAKDLDDAISLELDEDRNYVLGVHIADVSHYVRHKSPLDIEAYERGTSVYFIDKVVPMLPEALSNGICSLNEKEDRLCLSVFMTIDKKGEMIKSRFASTVIKSKIKGIYSEINEIFADIYKPKSESDKPLQNPDENASVAELVKKYRLVLPMLKRARKLAGILKKRRVKKGALELESVESEFIMSRNAETGEPEIADIKKAVTGESESIIEEFMLRANETAAEFLNSKDLPCIYRVHEQPFYEKIESFAATLRRFGYPPSSLKSLLSKKNEIHPKELQKVLNHFRNTPLFQTVNTQMLRSLAKARYSEKNFEHFGLASEKYCHFTSPIRRYPDLVNHRIIKMVLSGNVKSLNGKEFRNFTSLAAKQSTDKEISAVYAERDIEDLYRTIYMSRHIGDIFTGVISSVTNFGVFVMLDNTCEGLVHVRDMGDYFEFDSSTLELSSNFESYRIGQEVRIKVTGVSIIEGSVNFIFW